MSARLCGLGPVSQPLWFLVPHLGRRKWRGGRTEWQIPHHSKTLTEALRNWKCVQCSHPLLKFTLPVIEK